MDKSVRVIKDLQLSKCKKNLENHKFMVDIVDNRSEVIAVLDQYLCEGKTCSVGGSMSLVELDLLTYLENKKDINYLDRYNTNDPRQVFLAAMAADVYITSSNVVTMSGELYNVDGNGNRVAAITFGPHKVVVIVGENKLVANLDEAEMRMKSIAAPMNNVRLNRPNPCTKIGYCVDCNEATRICDSYLITKRSHTKDRIHVIIVRESLGY